MTPSLRPEDVQATFAATLVDEWVRGGLRSAVVCPGSRSTPLALALADHPGVEVHVHQDERSGGFMALGLALASSRPVAVLTTSGTAAVELHPAVVEAHHANIPLLVCTADRPPELRDVGAAQTIDQMHLYGRAVRWFADPGVPDVAGMAQWRGFAARALADAAGLRPGPVHLNLPFREPLVGTAGPLPAARTEGPWVQTSISRMAADAAPAAASSTNRLAGRRRAGTTAGAGGLSIGGLAGRCGVIFAGHPGPEASDLWPVAETLGWPVVADPRSSAWQDSPVTVAHLDGILRSGRAQSILRPEVILRLGAPSASRVVNEWSAASGAHEIVASGAGWSDPAVTAAVVLDANPAEVVAALAREVEEVDEHVRASSTSAVPGWLDRWRAASGAATQALEEALAGRPPTLSEPVVAREVVAALPEEARLVVSSSMPIRDVERYAAPRSGVQVLSNRGANGIDGVVSTAVGVALDGRTTGLLIGDLAFVHDSNGLLGAMAREIDLVSVVVDNDGGGIFSFLPQARSLPEAEFERLFGTPHGLDLVALAQAYGVSARAVDGDVAKAVSAAADEGGVHVLVVRTDRVANVDVHRLLDDAIATAVDDVLASFTS